MKESETRSNGVLTCSNSIKKSMLPSLHYFFGFILSPSVYSSCIHLNSPQERIIDYVDTSRQ